ncbi:MAG TPA: 8-oxoguanine deaminase, partial [Actinoplanes sp.]|nr:8-oxoguanine deaminase [Actinoplanes sp.]
GKLGDLVMWRLDGLGHDGIDDKVAALVFGPPAPIELALVGGKSVVERGELVHADAEALARSARRAHRRLLKSAQS